MPISVTCPDCNKTLNAPDGAAGKTGKCNCGAAIRIPAESPAQTATKVAKKKKVGARPGVRPAGRPAKGRPAAKKAPAGRGAGRTARTGDRASRTRRGGGESGNRRGRGRSRGPKVGMHLLLKIGLGMFVVALLTGVGGYLKVTGGASSMASAANDGGGDQRLATITGNGDASFSVDQTEDATIWFIGGPDDSAPEEVTFTCTDSAGNAVAVKDATGMSMTSNDVKSISLKDVKLPKGSYTLTVADSPDDAKYSLETSKLEQVASGAVGILAGLVYFLMAGFLALVASILSIIGLVKGRSAKKRALQAAEDEED